jgi:hypothetical protein
MKIPPVEGVLFHRDRLTDMMKLIITFAILIEPKHEQGGGNL